MKNEKSCSEKVVTYNVDFAMCGDRAILLKKMHSLNLNLFLDIRLSTAETMCPSAG